MGCGSSTSITTTTYTTLDRPSDGSTTNRSTKGTKSKQKSKPNKLLLYIWPGSAPCRAVLMAATAAKISVAIENVNIFKGEHKTEKLVKFNPEKTVPILEDKNNKKLELKDSHAIMRYLIDEYAVTRKQKAVYPPEIEKRPMVDRFLTYDLEEVYPKVTQWLYPQVFEDKPGNATTENELQEVLQYLDDQLAFSAHIASTKHPSIADFAVIANLSLLELVYFDFTHWKNLTKWRDHMKDLSFYPTCNQGLEDWKLLLHIKDQNELHLIKDA